MSYKTILKAYDSSDEFLKILPKPITFSKENSKRMNLILVIDEKERDAEVPVTKLLCSESWNGEEKYL